jgi:5'-nucleotidase
MQNKPLILITNDDSYKAKGIKELVEFVKDLGRIVVVAPKDPMSAKSHSITVTEPLWIKKLSENENITWFHLNGTPADCVKFALHEVLEERPALILSGINHGPNYSVSQFYSGTVAGAVEGTLNGIPSIAFSLNDFDSKADFSQAREFIRQITAEVLKNPLPINICLNVNFPSIEKELKGLKICRQTHGKWVESFVKQAHPYNGNYFWLTGTFTNFEPDAGDNDVWAVENGYASVLPLNIDMTDYDFMEKIRDWER